MENLLLIDSNEQSLPSIEVFCLKRRLCTNSVCLTAKVKRVMKRYIRQAFIYIGYYTTGYDSPDITDNYWVITTLESQSKQCDRRIAAVLLQL